MVINRREAKEFFQILFLLGISLIGSSIGILAFYAFSLFFLYRYKAVGATKLLLLLAFRSIVNDGMFYAISNMQSIKWVVMFGLSAYILFLYKIKGGQEHRKLSTVYIWLIGFATYTILDSFLVSSLPMISIFKFFSYAFVFAAILKGIALTYRYIDWLNWLEKLIGGMVLLSIPMYIMPAGWLGDLFKGFANQPNMLGIVLVLFDAILAVNINRLKRGRVIRLGLIVLAFVLVFLSGSRTGFISAVIIVILGLLFSKIQINNKIIILVLLLGGAYAVISINGDIGSYLSEFIYKYDGSSSTGNLLYSRESQIQEMLDNIMASPILGNGFGTPRLNFVSYTLSYTFFLEPGNLVLAILSYSGALGTLIFAGMLFSIILSNWKKNNNFIILPIATLLVSMGEMVFFSSNSMAIWLYAFWAIYMFNQNDIDEKEE